MPAPDIVLLDWSLPAADLAARFLIDSAPAGIAIDLSDVVALVPTQQSGRRLRESLARLGAESGRGVVSPVVCTPGQFLDPGTPDVAAASEAALFFIDAFESFGGGGLTGLFPNGNPLRTFPQRLAFARSILALRAGLAEAGFDLARAADRLGADYAEAARWRDLAELEARYRQSLRAAGREDRDDARIRLARDPAPPPGIRRIVLLGVADAQPLLVEALERRAASCAISVVIFADADGRERFDSWGRPRPEAWESCVIPWEDFEGQVTLFARPAGAGRIVRGLCPSAPPDGALVVGALDRDLLPAIEGAIDDAGGRLHDPDGEPMAAHWLPLLIRAWADFLDDPTFRSAAALLRNGAVIAWLRTRVRDFSLGDALTMADRIGADHLPDSVFDAMRWSASDERPSLDRALGELLAIRESLLGGGWLAALRQFLGDVIGAFQADLDRADLTALDAVAAEAGLGLRMLESHARRFAGLATTDWLRVLCAAVGAGRIYREAGPQDVEAAGWLELPWTAEPHVILAGMNQGLVPESAASDPFLPDSLRERLGLACNRSRFARDAWCLARILAQRAGGAGRVNVLVGQSAGNGDPLRPSRLLFLCGADELPARVRRLFGDPEPPDPEPPWNAGWLLKPPIVPLKRSISVTAFAKYLDCPFRFYLEFGLGMETFEPGVSEMDARVFGTLVHAALERFARDESICDSADAAEIRDYVLASLDDEVGRGFGPNLSVSLLVQVEAARRRLGAFAIEQARQRADGWRIDRAEIAFHDLLGRDFELDGWAIRGKIDRIDRNDARGLWRVLDYKTNDTATPPRDKHVRTPASAGFAPDYARLVVSDAKGKPNDRCWANLQLPLYRHALAETGVDPGAIICAYFNLPKAAASTAVAEWAGFDGELAGSALACARGVLADLAAGAFWPPNPRPAFDGFESFFPVDPAAMVDAGGFNPHGAA